MTIDWVVFEVLIVFVTKHCFPCSYNIHYIWAVLQETFHISTCRCIPKSISRTCHTPTPSTHHTKASWFIASKVSQIHIQMHTQIHIQNLSHTNTCHTPYKNLPESDQSISRLPTPATHHTKTSPDRIRAYPDYHGALLAPVLCPFQDPSASY